MSWRALLLDFRSLGKFGNPTAQFSDATTGLASLSDGCLYSGLSEKGPVWDASKLTSPLVWAVVAQPGKCSSKMYLSEHRTQNCDGKLGGRSSDPAFFPDRSHSYCRAASRLPLKMNEKPHLH